MKKHQLDWKKIVDFLQLAYFGVSPIFYCSYFKGKTYNGCPPDPEFPNRKWCSTKVDNRGNHITGKGKFGFCEEACPHHKDKSK